MITKQTLLRVLETLSTPSIPQIQTITHKSRLTISHQRCRRYITSNIFYVWWWPPHFLVLRFKNTHSSELLVAGARSAWYFLLHENPYRYLIGSSPWLLSWTLNSQCIIQATNDYPLWKLPGFFPFLYGRSATMVFHGVGQSLWSGAGHCFSLPLHFFYNGWMSGVATLPPCISAGLFSMLFCIWLGSSSLLL